MNSKSETPNQRRFRYSFDDLGYYLGLCYPIEESALQTPIFQPNSTDQEPYWKDGYIPRYDFHFKNWTLETRGQKEVRQTLEDELTEKILNKLLERDDNNWSAFVSITKDFKKLITDQDRAMNPIIHSIGERLGSLFAQIDRLDELTSKDLVSIMTRIDKLEETISNINKTTYQNFVELRHIRNKPTLWQKIKSFFTGNIQ